MYWWARALWLKPKGFYLAVLFFGFMTFNETHKNNNISCFLHPFTPWLASLFGMCAYQDMIMFHFRFAFFLLSGLLCCTVKAFGYFGLNKIHTHKEWWWWPRKTWPYILWMISFCDLFVASIWEIVMTSCMVIKRMLECQLFAHTWTKSSHVSTVIEIGSSHGKQGAL